jgi:iron complex transport system ATP-binding protein
MVLADGVPVAAGRVDDVVTSDVLSRAFGLPIEVTRHDGRVWARMTTRERHTEGG